MNNSLRVCRQTDNCHEQKRVISFCVVYSVFIAYCLLYIVLDKNTIRRCLSLTRKTKDDVFGNDNVIEALRSATVYNVFDDKIKDNG